MVITEIKLKQNKRKTMFRFSEIVLFQFRFGVWNKTLKQNKSRRGLSVNKTTSLREAYSCHNIYVIYDVNVVTTWRTNMRMRSGRRMLCMKSPWLQLSLLSLLAGSLCHILTKMSIWSSENLFAIFTVVILRNVINDIIVGGMRGH